MSHKLLTAEETAFIDKEAHMYFMEQGQSCGLTMLHILSDLLEFPLDPQVYAAMNGVLENRDRRGQCGLYKGSLMFLGIYGTAKGWDRNKINACTIDFAEKMENHFKSLKCYDLRGGRFQPGEPHDKCAGLVAEGVKYTAEYIKNIEF